VRVPKAFVIIGYEHQRGAYPKLRDLTQKTIGPSFRARAGDSAQKKHPEKRTKS
jgi:hypothetical protein